MVACMRWLFACASKKIQGSKDTQGFSLLVWMALPFLSIRSRLAYRLQNMSGAITNEINHKQMGVAQIRKNLVQHSVGGSALIF